MNMQEFTIRTGEQYADHFADAEKLYMALPNADKDTFCALWLLEHKTGLDLFGKLRKYLNAYNAEQQTNQVFNLFARPFHESAIAHEIEQELLHKVAAIRETAAALA